MIETKRAALIVALALHARLAVAAPPHLGDFSFTINAPAEIVATISARCDACAWDVDGREAVTLQIALDDRYVAHLPLVRSGRADYRLLLGPAKAGRHRIRIDVDADATARELKRGAATIENIAVAPVMADTPPYTGVSFAPIVYARANTLGRFTDVPVFMWYEKEPTARGVRYRYSVIFTNEDGGTPTDRLMATWGRTTDIEYIYSVEVDASGKVLEDDLQGPEHKILAFAGMREGRHPLLWVSTDNNMVRDTGTTRVRYAPAPIEFPLDGVSREAVMDANPWLYDVASRELLREGKIVDGAPPGRGTIPDPRQFVYVEACGQVGSAAVAVEIAARGSWFNSDRGVPEYKVVRDGCFRVAIPVGPAITAADLKGLRITCYQRPSHGGASAAAGTVRLDRINRVFILDERYVPRPSVFQWKGPATVESGTPLEISFAP